MVFLWLTIGLTWEDAHRRCPEGIVPACHNSHDTVTISGPAEAVSVFVAQLQAEGVFAKEVQSAGVAFHSYCMSMTAPALQEKLKEVCRQLIINTVKYMKRLPSINLTCRTLSSHRVVAHFHCRFVYQCVMGVFNYQSVLPCVS